MFLRVPTLIIVVMGLLAFGCRRLPEEQPTTADWTHHTVGLPFTVGYEAGLEKAAADNKPAFILVTAMWCKTCIKLAHDHFTDAASKQLLDRFELVLVDADVENDRAAQLNARSLPHIVIQKADGRTIAEASNFQSPDAFREFLTHALQASE